ncbi:helix-turn-helix domain-containing protein [Deinococcus wulumuqiensis]|nr:helix-turn-helix transcriptional regulator [Deinococcus wulumuqiensis]
MTNITKSSGNVFADMGLENPQEQLLKARLASLVQDGIEDADWTQAQAAEVLGVKQPDVSNLMRGRLDGFSVERLLNLLTRLGCEVTITVGKQDKSASAIQLQWSGAI